MFKITMLPFNKVGSKLRGERLNQVSFPITCMSILAKKKKIRQGKRLSLPPIRLIFNDVYLLFNLLLWTMEWPCLFQYCFRNVFRNWHIFMNFSEFEEACSFSCQQNDSTQVNYSSRGWIASTCFKKGVIMRSIMASSTWIIGAFLVISLGA